MADIDFPDDVDKRRETIGELAAKMRKLRDEAGKPSFRTMAGRSGRISHTTLHECVSGVRLPSWETTREFVRACGGNEAEWHDRWSTAVTALAADPPAGPPDDPGPKPRRPLRWLVPAVAAVLLLAAAAVFVFLPGPDTPPDTAASGPRVAGDASNFIGDVTIPDDTVVAPGQEFTKVWEIVNKGTVIWRGRYLERTDLPPAPDSCATPDRVEIGDTLPNERVKISVAVTAPAKAPATCLVKWKMVDSHGEPFFPSSRPVYFLVRVQA